jgi:SagB-type dehydrogenase family enzyme
VSTPDPDPPVPDLAPSVFASLREFAYERRSPWPGDGAPDDLAEEFHEASKVAAAFPAQALGPAGRQLLSSDDAPFALGRKALAHAGPQLRLTGPAAVPVDLRALTHRRRSRLPEHCGPVSLDQLGTILALSAGSSPTVPGLRVTPSGGAMYPLDVAVIAHRVDGLAPGGYLYDPIKHGLLARTTIRPAEFHARASAARPMPQPSLTLAVVATFARSRAKYGLRGYRFALLEAGHLVQAALTVATAVGLDALPWGGFIDHDVDHRLELDGLDRSCVYLLAISAGPTQPGAADE